MATNIDDILKMIAEAPDPTLEELIEAGERLVAANPVTPEAEADADAGIDRSPDEDDDE